MNQNIPPYAAHLSKETYEHWRSGWRRRHYFRVEEVNSVDDAAALIMIAATDAEELRGYPCVMSEGLFDDGRQIGTITALFNYKPDLAEAAIKKIFTDYFNPENILLRTVAYLLEAAKPKMLEENGIEKLLSFAETRLNLEEDKHKIVRPYDYHSAPDSLRLARQIIITTEIYGSTHPLPAHIPERAVKFGSEWIENAGVLDSFVIQLLNRYATDEQIEKLAPAILKAHAQFIKETVDHVFPDGELSKDWKDRGKELARRHRIGEGAGPVALIEAECQRFNEPVGQDRIQLEVLGNRLSPEGGLVPRLAPATVLALTAG